MIFQQDDDIINKNIINAINNHMVLWQPSIFCSFMCALKNRYINILTTQENSFEKCVIIGNSKILEKNRSTKNYN